MPASKLASGLTIKETGFVKDLIETGNATEAARRNYSVHTRGSAAITGHIVRKKPHIKEAIERALEKKGLDLDRIAENVKDIANIRVNKADAKTVLHANLEVIKILGGYDKHNITTNYKFCESCKTLLF